MRRNEGQFINRETEYLVNGDKAITDTFMLSDGTLVYHTYNVTSGGRAHSHQVMDEYGRHLYARAIGEDLNHPWIEIDRMNAIRWLTTLSQDKLNLALKLMNYEELQLMSNLFDFNDKTNDEICDYKQRKICR